MEKENWVRANSNSWRKKENTLSTEHMEEREATVTEEHPQRPEQDIKQLGEPKVLLG